MNGVRRALTAAVLMALAAGGSAALVAPAALAAPPGEYKISWSLQQVTDIRRGIGVGDNACNALAVAGGVVTGPLGVTKVAAGAIGTVTGLGGWAMCGHSDPKLREAVEAGFHRGCGVDAYFTDGPLSYDRSARYVVCP
jgi:hypothetical protein